MLKVRKLKIALTAILINQRRKLEKKIKNLMLKHIRSGVQKTREKNKMLELKIKKKTMIVTMTKKKIMKKTRKRRKKRKKEKRRMRKNQNEYIVLEGKILFTLY